MENLYDILSENLAMTLKSLQKLAKNRGWPEINLLRGKEAYLFATRPDGKKLKFLSGAVPETSYFSGVLADDKLASAEIFRSINVKHPETIALKNSIKNQLEDLLSRHAEIVIKPADGAHGNDVFTGIKTLDAAVQIARNVKGRNPESAILAQEQLKTDGRELRIICIGYKFALAIARIPARVTGDGVHSVRELIKIENKTLRTAPYQSDLAYIDEAMSAEYIEKHEIADHIPKSGEKVQVVGLCNIGRGGTVETVEVSKEQQEQAEKIAEAFSLPVIGIDYLNDYVLEVNSTPSLYYPLPDENKGLCVEKWLEYLESI